MKISNFLFVLLLLLIEDKVKISSYKIDFENGANRIHLESTEVQDGKIVNEPKVEEAIKTLSSYKFNNNLNNNKEANQHANKQQNTNQNLAFLESNDNARIFITNINKNINTNEEQVTVADEKKKLSVTGHGRASVVPMMTSKTKTPGKITYSKPLRATRPIESAASWDRRRSDAPAPAPDVAEKSIKLAEAPANLARIVPELLTNPLKFVQENENLTKI